MATDARSKAAVMLEAWAKEIGQEGVAVVLGKSQPTISRWIVEKGAPPDYETRVLAWKKRKIPMGAWWKRGSGSGDGGAVEAMP
jgi:hypothetical protein